MGFGLTSALPLDQMLLGPAPSWTPDAAGAPAAPPAAAPPQAAPASGAQPYKPSIWDIAQGVIFDGQSPAEAAMAARQRNYQAQTAALMLQTLQHASPTELKALLTNPTKYGEEFAKNFAPINAAEGSTEVMFGGPAAGGLSFMAPKVGIDKESGKPFAISTQGLRLLGPSLGGDFEAKDGIIASKRTGQVGGRYETPQSIAPGNTLHGFTPGVAGDGAAPPSDETAGGPMPTSVPTAPRGLRNLNFGNLKPPPHGQWDGQTGVDQDGYAVFGTPEAGAKAALTNLLSYAKQGVNTPLAIAQRWAPAGDGKNDPISYGHFLAGQLGVGVNDPIDLMDPKVQKKALQGIFAFENGPQALSAWRFAKPAAGRDRVVAQGNSPRLLSPEEARAAGFAPGAVPERAADGTVTVKQQGYGPDQIFSLRRQVLDDDSFKNFKQANDAYGAMINAAAQPNGGMRAYALRDTFARLINPGAVARVGTIQAISEAQGVPANVKAYFMNLTGDGNVPPEIAQQILDVSKGFLDSHYKAAKSLNDNVVEFARRKGIDPEDVSAPVGEAPARMVLGPVPQDPSKRQPQVIYPTPKGPLLWTGKGWRKIN